MNRTLLLSVTLLTWLVAASAHATTYPAFAWEPGDHAVALHPLGEPDLEFDPGATLTVGPTEWTLLGDLTSLDNGSKWTIDVTFTGVLTGDEFGVLTGFDDSRIKGADWSDQNSDWAFAESVTGTLHALTGAHAGREFSIERMPGSHNYYAQFGTCLNDKNCDKGLSSWLTFTDVDNLQTYKGDINMSVGAPVPEPSTGLMFGAGMFMLAITGKRRNLSISPVRSREKLWSKPSERSAREASLHRGESLGMSQNRLIF